MKGLPMRDTAALCVGILMLVLPAVATPQTAPPAPPRTETTNQAPPVAPVLVREGDFAVKLQVALGLGTSEDEVEAENRLGEAGVTPRNGWIADYPVTPDIVGELRTSVSAAADAGKIKLGREDALKRLDDVSAGLQIAVQPHSGAKSYETSPEMAEQYPNPAAINNYYTEQGPPVVTYYAPPPDFYYLYAWVPYPFWWWGFWFPGFFVLHDFHRPIFIHNRWCFVSNHFNDVRANRVFRVDPVARFSGRTFAGIGVTNRKGFIQTGVPRSEQRIFNGPRTLGGPGGRTITPPSTRGGSSFVPPSRGGRPYSAPPRGMRPSAPPAGSRSAPGGRSHTGGSMGGPPAGGGGGVRGR